jgi:hypothetical protein
MRKLRKTGALDQEGNLITIPRLPSVTGTNKPPRWNRWSAAEKVEHLLGISLDRMQDYLSWPADGLDPYRPAAQTQVIRVVAMVGAKVGDQARREREGRRTVDELLRKISRSTGLRRHRNRRYGGKPGSGVGVRKFGLGPRCGLGRIGVPRGPGRYSTRIPRMVPYFALQWV